MAAKDLISEAVLDAALRARYSELGRKGGRKMAESRGPKHMSEIGKAGIAKRWAKSAPERAAKKAAAAQAAAKKAKALKKKGGGPRRKK